MKDGVEMWVISGTLPVTWQIPVLVEHVGDGMTSFCSAMQLTSYQRETLSQQIGHNMERGRWRLSQTQLGRIGKKVNATGRAEDHFIWTPRRGSLWLRNHKIKDRSEFVASMYLKGVGKSETEIEYWLNQFCNHMVWWLLNKETPIDLYFAKLWPWPLRTNWKEKFKAEKTDPWKRRAFYRFHRHRTFIAWDRTACLRGVEMELTPVWYRLMRRVEHDRVKMLGRDVYAERYLRWILRVREQFKRIWTQWYRDRGAPSPQFIKGAKTLPRRFQSRIGITKDPACIRFLDGLVPPEREREERKAAELRRVQIKKARRMREMRHFRPEPAHLWAARQLLHRAADGKFLPAGVSMPDGSESLSEKSNVLVKGPGI